MKFSIAAVAALAGFAFAAPSPVPVKSLLQARQAGAVGDADILQYALTLEYLEAAFYRQGLANYTADAFVSAGFTRATYDHVVRLASDEATHVAFLRAGLTAAGVTPVRESVYKFPSTDVKSFLAVASVLEGVGVSAYLGAAANILSKNYLTAAGSILTVEARHSSYLREQLGMQGFPVPFDTPLTYSEVYTLAAQFIVSSPDTLRLPIKAFPTVVAAPASGPIQTGTTITLLTPGYTLTGAANAQIYAAFITVTGPVFAPATPVAGGFTVKVPGAPAGTAPIGGQTYVVLTTCNTVVSDATIAAGPAIVEISN